MFASPSSIQNKTHAQVHVVAQQPTQLLDAREDERVIAVDRHFRERRKSSEIKPRRVRKFVWDFSEIGGKLFFLSKASGKMEKKKKKRESLFFLFHLKPLLHPPSFLPLSFHLAAFFSLAAAASASSLALSAT